MLLAILAAVKFGLLNNLNLLGNLVTWFMLMQVSITLIATGFKRQEEQEGRTTKVTNSCQISSGSNFQSDF
jgi:hypothetical protein